MADPKPQPSPRRAPARRPAAPAARAKRGQAVAGRPVLRRWGWAILGGVLLVVGLPLAVALVGDVGALVILALIAGILIGRAWR
ncbi:hypothetical protein ACQW02_03850 [Humitalea sp. 24SJ18S-53]|uniref:hypothetical protein n=1 Tax=Humitalea sp. 24SJ18S-53 TaxID=3422307 RepID=UPI003D670147